MSAMFTFKWSECAFNKVLQWFWTKTREKKIRKRLAKE